MINRLYRFHGHNSLSYLLRNGRTERVELLSLKYAPNKRDDYRLAVVVSKKVSKSAVVRNRIRRRIYEVVRLAKKTSAKKWPYDMAIFVYDESVATLPSDKLTQSIESLLKKSRILP
jgi:ribonuclease P protein component